MKIKMIVFLAILTVIFTGCSIENQTQEVEGNNTSLINNFTNNNLQLKTLKSPEELKQLTVEGSLSMLESISSNSLNLRGTQDMVAFDSVSSSSKSSVLEGSTQSKEFTQTNNQESQVDEADFVKTDGDYIYTLAGNTLTIVDVQEPDNSNIIFEKEFSEDKDVQNIFIKNNTLVAIGHINSEIIKVSSNSLEPYRSYETQTFVEIYDMTQRENLVLVEEYEVSGNYFDARLIGEHIYFISQKSVGTDFNFPALYRSGTRIAQPDVMYFDWRPSSQYYTISSVNLENTEQFEAQTYLLDYGTTLYVSENAIYMGYQKQVKDNLSEKFEKVVVPEIDSSRQAEFEIYLENEEYETLAEELENYISGLNDKEDFLERVQERRNGYYNQRSAEQRKTIIHKFEIANGSIEHTAEQEIEGHLLNQFSLGEHNGNLRVATTTRNWIQGEGTNSYNNVFVLDEDLELLGSLEGLAENEQIYSARFMGEKLYLVTYERVDPLFVIDLSNPQNPTVLGKLKIPGFSSYLHPYKEDYLIGVGKETRENQQGFIETIGLKISLFDVSDVENPVEVDNHIIEGRYTNSIVLQEHKAFTFLESQELLVLPVQQQISNQEYFTRSNKAFVFSITQSGIEKKSEISHSSSNQQSYSHGSKAILRSVIIDSHIYTISQEEIVITNTGSFEEVLTISLSFSSNQRNYYPYFR